MSQIYKVAIDKLFEKTKHGLTSRHTRQFSLSSLLTITFLIGYSLIFWYYDLNNCAIVSLIAAVIESLLFALVIRKGLTMLLGNLATLVGYTAITFVIFNTNGLQSPSVIWLVVPPLFSLFFVGSKSGLLWSIITLVTIIVLFYLYHSLGQFTPVFKVDSLYLTLQYIGQLNLILFFFWIYYSELSIQRQQNEESKEEILSQLEHLQINNRLRDKLISVISHDFKSPLLNIQSIIQMMSRNALTKDEQRELLPKLAAAVGTTLESMDNFLNWSLMQDGTKLRIHPEIFPVEKVINDVFEFCHGVASQKNIKLSHQCESNDFILADPRMIEVVIRNLITNALKFSPKNSRISIHSLKEDQQIKIFIKDEGVGIPNSVAAKLFKETITTQGTSFERGTGFGLLLCKDFAEKNNGTICLEETSQAGTTFILSLPAA